MSMSMSASTIFNVRFCPKKQAETKRNVLPSQTCKIGTEALVSSVGYGYIRFSPHMIKVTNAFIVTNQTLFGTSETNTCWAFVCERLCTPSLGSLLESNRRSDPAPEHQTARHLLGSRDPLQGTAGTQDYKTRKIFPNKRDSGDSGEFLFPKKHVLPVGPQKIQHPVSKCKQMCLKRQHNGESVSL